MERDITSRMLHSLEKKGLSKEQRLLILYKEVALAGYELMSISRFPDEEKEHRELLKLELADAAVQLQMFMLDMGFDPDEVLELGINREWEKLPH